jgi:hypothetical protein
MLRTSSGLVGGLVLVPVWASVCLGQCPPGQFDYGPTFANAEAEQLALELAGQRGPLLVDPAVYERIDRDMELIRSAVPPLRGVPHDPAWADNVLIIGYTDLPLSQQVECRNEFYQVTNVQLLTGIRMALITFPRNVNFEALAVEYLGLEGVRHAGPNGVIYECKKTWTPEDLGGGLWLWTVEELRPIPGMPFSCTREEWVFQVDAGGSVRFVSGPCYADCNGDGVLDFFDFLCFQNAFLALDPWADCNGDGLLDFFDFLCFQNSFLTGCP